MSERDRRRELQEEYKQRQTEAGVYRIVNDQNGRYFLGSAPDLRVVCNKLAFARTTGMPGVFDRRLSHDIRQCGIGAFSLEVLEVLETTPEMTADEIKRDLSALEELWREKLDPALAY